MWAGRHGCHFLHCKIMQFFLIWVCSPMDLCFASCALALQSNHNITKRCWFLACGKKTPHCELLFSVLKCFTFMTSCFVIFFWSNVPLCFNTMSRNVACFIIKCQSWLQPPRLWCDQRTCHCSWCCSALGGNGCFLRQPPHQLRQAKKLHMTKITVQHHSFCCHPHILCNSACWGNLSLLQQLECTHLIDHDQDTTGLQTANCTTKRFSWCKFFIHMCHRHSKAQHPNHQILQKNGRFKQRHHLSFKIMTCDCDVWCWFCRQWHGVLNRLTSCFCWHFARWQMRVLCEVVFG